jgi:hypothetical protein
VIRDGTSDEKTLSRIRARIAEIEAKVGPFQSHYEKAAKEIRAG